MDFIDNLKADYWLGVGDRRFEGKKYKLAIKAYLRAAELKLGMRRYADVGLCYRKIGDCFMHTEPPLEDDKLKDRAKAADYYVMSAEKHLSVGDYVNVGNSFESAAKSYEIVGDFENAAGYRLKSAEAYGKTGNKFSTSLAYLHTAEYYERINDYDKAALAYAVSAKINMEVEDYHHASIGYRNAAKCYEKLSEYDKAIDCYSNSAAVDTQLREFLKVADNYDDIAHCYHDIKDYKNAVYYHKKSAEVRFENRDYSAAGFSYKHIGEIYEETKEYDNAIEYHIKSAESNLKSGNHMQVALAYEKTALCHEQKKDYKNAAEYYVFSAKSSIIAGKNQDASQSYKKAAKMFIQLAEDDIKNKKYADAATAYKKAAEAYVGLKDWLMAAETYLKYAEAELGEGIKENAAGGFKSAGENYIKSGDLRDAAESYIKAGDYKEASRLYIKYAEERQKKEEYFRAGEGYKNAARCYTKLGDDTLRRESYNKAISNFNWIINPKKKSESKDQIKKIAEASRNNGECYLDTADLENSRKYFKKALEHYEKINDKEGVDITRAFLSRVEAEIAMEPGYYPKADELLHTSRSLFEKIIKKGGWNGEYRKYLMKNKEEVEKLIDKIELKPDIILNVDKRTYTFVDTPLLLNIELSNNGRHNIQKINFLAHLPDDMELIRLPDSIKKLKSAESKKTSTEIICRKVGDYRIKPLEIFYQDEHGNKYVKSSNEISLGVEERPPSDFKNYLKAVDVYLRYAKIQLENTNYFYAGTGFKEAADVYGKFKSDEILKDYYHDAIDAYKKFIELESKKETSDPMKIKVVGDAFWNIGECYSKMNELNNARKFLGEALTQYEKSASREKVDLVNAFLNKVEAKIAIEHGDYARADELLKKSLKFFDESIKRGGWSPEYVKYLELNEDEARSLREKLELKPEVYFFVESPRRTIVGEKFSAVVRISNTEKQSIRDIKFMLKTPSEFRIENAPKSITELKPGESKTSVVELRPKKTGEFTFKPMDVTYTDESNKNFMKGSNEITVRVEGEVARRETELKDEGKPNIDLVLERIAGRVYVGEPLVITGRVANSWVEAVNSIRFLDNSPQDFETVEIPKKIKELAPGDFRGLEVVLRPKKAGEFVFKPLEMFYRDVHGNKFFKSSNELIIDVSGDGDNRQVNTASAE